MFPSPCIARCGSGPPAGGSPHLELRANLTQYDAAYVAFAERLRRSVLTRDARLARSSGHRARIEVV